MILKRASPLKTIVLLTNGLSCLLHPLQFITSDSLSYSTASTFKLWFLRIITIALPGFS